MSFSAVFRRELENHLNLKVLLIYVLILLIPLILFSNLSEEAQMFSNLTLDLKVEYLTGFFLIFAFVWICGFALSVITIYKCSGFIAEEVSSRTLLLMVSKPIKRHNFILAKFLAFFIFILLLQLLSLFVTLYFWASFFKLDVFSLAKVLRIVPPLMVYSTFIILVFGTLSTAFSSIFSSRTKAILPLIAIVIIAFIIFVPVRGAARSSGIYESYFLDTLDIGYDFGNIYVSILENSGVKPVPFIQGAIGSFTGTYIIPEGGVKVDYDHSVILESLDRAGYHSLEHSLLKLTLAPMLILILSVLIFQRRDVH
ncbi:MAG: hypothetical protein DRP11_00700 [Candidatus Aenigmatarchaeota archaeon]|nr:MAG: hypothetical protein DRP11_00700 [Candidatus Aenigmarchaeota archaeon]